MTGLRQKVGSKKFICFHLKLKSMKCITHYEAKENNLLNVILNN